MLSITASLHKDVHQAASNSLIFASHASGLSPRRSTTFPFLSMMNLAPKFQVTSPSQLAHAPFSHCHTGCVPEPLTSIFSCVLWSGVLQHNCCVRGAGYAVGEIQATRSVVRGEKVVVA